MKGRLRMRLGNEIGDGWATILVEFEAAKFAGIGEAYLPLEGLKQKAGEFAQYPLRKDRPAVLEGGLGTSERPNAVREEYFHISAFPTSARGDVAILVRVAKPHDDPNLRPGLRYSASAEFSSSYEQLLKFSQDLVALAKREIHELELLEL